MAFFMSMFGRGEEHLLSDKVSCKRNDCYAKAGEGTFEPLRTGKGTCVPP